MSDQAATKPIWAQRILQARGTTSQEEFAHQVGVATRTVQRWEAGEYSPRYSGALKLSRATGKSAAFFLGEDDAEEEEAARVARMAQAMLAEAFGALSAAKTRAIA